jgi:hypothetical protein
MLVLADETLEAFFDSGFANSFHLADAPLRSTTLTSPSFLSVHSGAASPRNGSGNTAMTSSTGSISPGPSSAGVVAPGKGLRGMLDNIVTDGMRVAAEVRRRMEEAQREVDRGAVTRGTGDDDEDDGEEEEFEGARDLLEGAEADAGAGSKSSSSSAAAGASGDKTATSLLDAPLVAEPSSSSGRKMSSAASIKSTSSEVEKSTMFER